MCDINEIEWPVNWLIYSVLKNDVVGKGESSMYVVSIGAPALNCLTRKLEVALLDYDSNVVSALGTAITDIWEMDKCNQAVSNNKEKVRTLVSRCPSMTPQINKVLNELRQAIGQKPTAHASTLFLSGLGASYANISAVIDGQKNVRRFPICKN